MPLFLYTCLYYLLLPLIVLRLLQRSLRAPAYRRRIAERFAWFAPPPFNESLWVHAVSVGEVIAAAPVIKGLQAAHPSLPLVVTTMTPTGSERVRALFGDDVFHVYAPYDLPPVIRRFLRRVQPRLLLIMETEIWPNTVLRCRRLGIPVVLANARLSAKSARGYGRVAALTRPVFGAISTVVAQTEDDALRFRALGVGEDNQVVSGSVKFDIALSPALQQQARVERGALGAAHRPVWIVASTHGGEEPVVVDALKNIRARLPDVLLMIAPRHPERFDEVAALLERAGLTLARRSAGESAEGRDALLIDTMGELMLLFGCADVASVGGSFVEHGGHNSLEPAAWGLPIVSGPSDYNFAEISRLLREAGALKVVDDGGALAREVSRLLSEPEAAKRTGEAARSVVAANRGALDRLLAVVDGYLLRR